MKENDRKGAEESTWKAIYRVGAENGRIQEAEGLLGEGCRTGGKKDRTGCRRAQGKGGGA